MKVIELKKLEGDSRGRGVLDYRDMLRLITEMPTDPRSPMKITEIRQCNRVLDAIETADGNLELEDADYSYLRNKVEEYGWPMGHHNIEVFVDDVIHAKSRKKEETIKEEAPS